jgi:aspartyl-tRNA(Asn)/glutamyl-tRNA(Gln) amidotransferase subunit C
MAITREDVLHVAALARLELGEDEIGRLTEQLNDILAAVGKVSELDLSDVPPTSHPLSVVNAFRPTCSPRCRSTMLVNVPEAMATSSALPNRRGGGVFSMIPPPLRRGGGVGPCSSVARSRAPSCARHIARRSMRGTRS